MVVNDSPGEECRIAILQNNHLEDLYTERHATATDVGNIYKGRVVNVEPAIQAAFIDYGQGANGFLHISDLHPKYFPGEERTERVGKKIPRRDRPPMQAALRRGDEILVQVLKEGIGTKGPTLTSYLSIPGRLLVMMPDMDRVGVSRKVEDEEKRREMRKILDSLNLPEGFGFILRTAGFGKTKTELKRDAAYLMRLWKVMEKRIKGMGAPCELYTESDLLIRTIRDALRPSVKAIVVDSESAYERVMGFLSVVAPRSAPKVIRYSRAAPIFHAFDIERQIELIHAREVPLASGGRLVIDQTEALVAIDVNSGRSRSARDSETNAYETNIQATDEICRQLRLRDLGGLIVNDLIDMRSMKHRKAIEEQFTNNFKRDRARTTITHISEFGILEMTRQRMRPSLRKAHFMDCPHCNGHGEIKLPESVAADAVRHIGFLLQYERVHRVEAACSPRVASVLLSGKRRELVRMEDQSGKRIEVRVSEAIAMDRVDYYAYDDRNADIDISRLPPLQMPAIEDLEKEQTEPSVVEGTDGEEVDEAGGGRRRGRRRRGRRGPADATAIALAGNFDEELEALGYDEEEDDVIAGADDEDDDEMDETADGEARPQAGAQDQRRQRQPQPQPQQRHGGHQQDQGGQPGQPGEGGKRWRRKRRRGGRGRRGRGSEGQQPQPFNGDMSQGRPGVAIADGQGNGEGASVDQSVRVHELARELNVSASEVIERAEPDPAVHNFTSPLATVSADEANTIRQMFGQEPIASQGEGAGDHAIAAALGLPGGAGSAGGAGEGGGKRKRRRRRRGGRGRGGQGGQPGGREQQSQPQQSVDASDESRATNDEFVCDPSLVAPMSDDKSDSMPQQLDNGGGMDSQNESQNGGAAAQPGGRKRRRRRRRGRGGGGGAAIGGGAGAGGGAGEESGALMSTNTSGHTTEHQASHKPGAHADQASGSRPEHSSSSNAGGGPTTPAKKPRRALYRAGRGSVSVRAREGGVSDDE